MEKTKNGMLKTILSYEQFALFLSLIALCVISTILSPVFLTGMNLMNVLRAASLTAISAMGMMLILVLGEIDLSVGSVQAIVGIVSVIVLNKTNSMVLSLIVALLLGCGIGLINGLLVTKGQINSMIATLGTMAVFRGLSYIVSGGISIQARASIFSALGTGYIGPVPIPLVVAIIIFIVLAYAMKYMEFGRNIFAIGGNESAAKLCGIPVIKIQLKAFIICGVLTAFSGFILASRLSSGQPNAGTGFEFQVISAVVLGGVSLNGGKGNIIGVIIGVLILSVLSNILTLCNVSSFYQEVARGIVILLAVYMDSRNKKVNERKTLLAQKKA